MIYSCSLDRRGAGQLSSLLRCHDHLAQYLLQLKGDAQVLVSLQGDRLLLAQTCVAHL